MRRKKEERREPDDRSDIPAEEWLSQFRPVRPDALTAADRYASPRSSALPSTEPASRSRPASAAEPDSRNGGRGRLRGRPDEGGRGRRDWDDFWSEPDRKPERDGFFRDASSRPEGRDSGNRADDWDTVGRETRFRRSDRGDRRGGQRTDDDTGRVSRRDVGPRDYRAGQSAGESPADVSESHRQPPQGRRPGYDRHRQDDDWETAGRRDPRSARLPPSYDDHEAPQTYRAGRDHREQHATEDAAGHGRAADFRGSPRTSQPDDRPSLEAPGRSNESGGYSGSYADPSRGRRDDLGDIAAGSRWQSPGSQPLRAGMRPSRADPPGGVDGPPRADRSQREDRSARAERLHPAEVLRADRVRSADVLPRGDRAQPADVPPRGDRAQPTDVPPRGYRAQTADVPTRADRRPRADQPQPPRRPEPLDGGVSRTAENGTYHVSYPRDAVGRAAGHPGDRDDDIVTSPLPVILPGATSLPRPAPVAAPRGPFEPARPSQPSTAPDEPPARPASVTGSVEPPPATYPARQIPEAAAAKLDQIKDLYLTAEAIGEEALDKHFEQVSERQRQLIKEFFERSGPAAG